MAPFDRSHSIGTMALSCIVCETERVIGQKSQIFIPSLYLVLPQGVTHRNFMKMLDTHKPRMTGLLFGEQMQLVMLLVHRTVLC